MILGGFLLGLALLVNLDNKKMLALTFIVAAGFFVEIPMDTAEEFYRYCMIVETCVFIAAYNVRCFEKYWIMLCAGLLFLCHCMGYWKDGYLALSPYRVLVPALEYAQFACCIILSRLIQSIMENRGRQAN